MAQMQPTKIILEQLREKIQNLTDTVAFIEHSIVTCPKCFDNRTEAELAERTKTDKKPNMCYCDFED